MTQEKKYGIAGTVIINTTLLLLLLFTYITLSKPVSTEGGILINFGDVESAEGLYEPALNAQQATAAPENDVLTAKSEEGLLTQDHEEAPAIKNPVVTKKTVTKPVNETPVKPKVTTEIKKPVVNSKALYKSSGQSTTESGSSEGIYKGSGNMGDPSGSTESDNYAKGLGGNGIAFNLNGRNPIYLQEPEFKIQKEGAVVVEITVDKTGRVISATPGVKGSTLVDNTLYAAAKKAALESKFDLNDNAPERQIGTITYHFKLQ
jgi:TonB family protein